MVTPLLKKGIGECNEMSEKRFYLDEEDRLCIHYEGRILASVGFQETEAQKIVDVLNEQQDIINKQDDEIKKLKRTERSWRKIHCCNKESNNCGIVIEQQNIISKLESDLQKIPPKIRELWIGED